jgi:group I intron endonuclease
MYIYLITNTANSKRYVGKTKRTLARRFNEHKASSRKKSKTHLSNAMRMYGVEVFIIEEIEKTTKGLLNERERFFIAKLQPEYNMTSGGDGIIDMSDEIKAKISAANKGRKKSEEHKTKISVQLSKYTKTEEHRKNISIALLGKSPSEETRAKLSASRKGKTRSADAVAKTAAAHLGTKRSEETRQKLRDIWAARRMEKERGQKKGT